MRYGINIMLWTDTLNDASLPLLDEIKQIGYDTVELPIMVDDMAAAKRWGARLDEIGLGRSATHCAGPDSNLLDPDASRREKAVENLKRIIDNAAAAGACTLMGPYHSTLGQFSGKAPTADEWNWGVEGMKRLAEHAAACQVKLAVEYLNRFECYFLNTAADLARFLDAVDTPGCGAVYDTFHAHIEEKDPIEAIRTLKKHLNHVHISENDRSTPGTGGIRWKEVFATLKEVGYDGDLVVEAFGASLPHLTAATKIWRTMFESEHQLASDALKFMKANTR